MTEWNKELEKKILRKSRFTLTMRILRIFLLGMLVFGIYTILLNSLTEHFQLGAENDFYTKLALDWKVPNVRGTFDFEEEAMSLLGTKKISYSLVKKVGKADVVIGEANVTKRLSASNSFIDYQIPGREQLNDFNFFYPEDPRNGKKLVANAEPEVWETLEMLHEGTVGELAFSTNHFMEPEELIQTLESYDVDILWMPLYTGEFVDFEPGGYGTSGEDLSVQDGIGITGTWSTSDDYLSKMKTNGLDRSSMAESKKSMMENMETLLTEKSSAYTEQFLGLSHLKARSDYLKKNGFTVYGAVITGPVKELLKLENEEMIQGEQLGEVELWNWENS